jgi:predicted N-formylglutamate amidohydrolase
MDKRLLSPIDGRPSAVIAPHDHRRPYSGKPPDRLIHAAHTHGRRHSIEYLELEIRQDLIDAPARAAAVAERIAAALREIA